jgi:hypothetical protein
MNARNGFSLRRAGGLTAFAGAITLGIALFASQAAMAGGNPDFEGILSAAQPTGFTSSPFTYNTYNGSVSINFDVVTKNITDDPQTVALTFSAHHILTYNGVDVSDGQPGQPGITFSGPDGTTQALMPGSQPFTETWTPMGTQNLALTYNFTACGYYQLDVWAPFSQGGDNGRGRATLASGFIRVLGCGTSPTPTPTPTATPTATPTSSPTPSGGVGGATATPTPDGGVQGITTTPSTGAGSGWLTIGAALVIAGAGMLVVGVRGRRIDI